MKRKFLLALICMTLFNLADMWSTWFCMPDLRYEANPWVVKYKLGWPGLLGVVFAYQLFYTFFVYFRYYQFKGRDYSIKTNNRIFHLAGIYFSGSNKKITRWRGKQWKECLFAIFNYLGFYLPVFFCMSKLLVTISNTIFGIIRRNATNEIKPNGWLILHVEEDSFLKNTGIGQWMVKMNDLTYAQEMVLHDRVIQITALIALIYFIVKELKYAKNGLLTGPHLYQQRGHNLKLIRSNSVTSAQ